MSELICAQALETQAKWEQEPEFLRADKLQVVINFNIWDGLFSVICTVVSVTVVHPKIKIASLFIHRHVVTNLLFCRTKKMIFWQMDHSHSMFQSDLFSTEWKQRQWEGKNLAPFKTAFPNPGVPSGERRGAV